MSENLLNWPENRQVRQEMTLWIASIKQDNLQIISYFLILLLYYYESCFNFRNFSDKAVNLIHI